MKRLVVFAYNADDGLVGPATQRLLEAFDELADRLVVVCNGVISAAGRKTVKKITADIYCLNCKNAVQVAYADALWNYVGQEHLEEYDEITLVSDAVWGPLCDLRPIYEEMEQKGYEYWQISNTVPSHEFVVLNKPFFTGEYFGNYMQGVISEYRRSFQNIINKLQKKVTISNLNLFSETIPNSYLREYDAEGNKLLAEKKISDFEHKLSLVADAHYPFWYKCLSDISVFDIAENKYEKDIVAVIREIEKSGAYDFSLIEKEMELSGGDAISVDNKELVDRAAFGKLYMSLEHGYTEQDACDGFNLFNRNGDFKVTFYPNCGSHLEKLRYDPLEDNSNTVITLYRCLFDGKELEPSDYNAIALGKRVFVFTSADPWFEFSCQLDGLKEVTIEGNIMPVTADFAEQMRSCEVSSYFSRFFWDDGQGFSEERKITKGLFIDSLSEFEIQAECDLRNIKALRFDPIEGKKCRLQIYSVRINGKEAPIKKVNGTSFGKKTWEFETRDPWFVLGVPDKDISSIYVTGKIEIQ